MLNMSDTYSILKESVSKLNSHLSRAPFDVGFHINTFEVDNLSEHPDISRAPKHGRIFGDYSTKIGWCKYLPLSDKRGNMYGRKLRMAVPMSPSPYHALRWAGFRHDQILKARFIDHRIDVKTIYEVKISNRTYRLHFFLFEQFLGRERGYDHGRGYDSIDIYWDYDSAFRLGSNPIPK